MECSNCNTKMEKGMMTGDSRHWIKEKSTVGTLNKMVNPGFGKLTVWAYHCPNCKKVELVSE